MSAHSVWSTYLRRRLCVILCACTSPACAQIATGWKGTAGAGWTVAANWDNTGPNAGARDLFFGNGWVTAGRGGSLISNNNIGDYHGHKIFFEGIVDPVTFTIQGNEIDLFDFGGAGPVYPQIYNNSPVLQIINAPIKFNDTSGSDKAEINAVNGDFSFGSTIDMAGTTQLQIYGINQKTVTFNAPITSTGNGGANSFLLHQNTNVIFKAANTYTGNTFIDAGHLQFDTGGSITSTIRLGDTAGTANAAIDLLPASGGLTMSRTINPRAGTTGNTLSVNSLNTSGVNTLSGHFGLDHDLLIAQVAGGSLDITQLRASETDTATGMDIKGFTTTFFAAGDIHMSGTVYNSTGTGKIIKNGAGLMRLSSANTYSGTTTINEGTLQIGAGTTSGAIAASSNITATGVGGALSFNRSDGITFANPISGNVAIAQDGSGTTTLVGANTSTGATRITAGALRVGAGTTSGSLGTGPIVNDGTLVFDRSDTTQVAAIVSGTGALENAGSGTLILTGDQAYSGRTKIHAGTLQLGAGASGAALQSDQIDNSAAISIATSAPVTIPQAIVGLGDLHQNGTGTTTLTADNSYNGVTRINAGAIHVGGGTTSGSVGIGDVFNESMLIIDRSDLLYLSVNISGAGSLTQAGTGTTQMAGGAYTYTGQTIISGGTIQLGDGSLSTSFATSQIVNNAALNISGTSSSTLPNPISGTGAVYHDATDATTISGANSYSGGTTVNAGTMVLTHASALGTGSLATAGGNVVAAGGLPSAIKLNGLSISNPTTVDLSDNDLVVTSATSKSQIEAYILTACSGGAWDASGLTSSAARDQVSHATTLGVMSGAQYNGLLGPDSVFSGVVVNDSDTLVKYTWYGDTDFNGVVNFDDYARIDAGFNNGGTDWFAGDFDLSGGVNFDDYALIDLAFNTQTTTLRVTAVPEPCAPIAFASIAMMMTGKRRRNKRR